jgi:hypothetical protein
VASPQHLSKAFADMAFSKYARASHLNDLMHGIIKPLKVPKKHDQTFTWGGNKKGKSMSYPSTNPYTSTGPVSTGGWYNTYVTLGTTGATTITTTPWSNQYITPSVGTVFNTYPSSQPNQVWNPPAGVDDYSYEDLKSAVLLKSGGKAMVVDFKRVRLMPKLDLKFIANDPMGPFAGLNDMVMPVEVDAYQLTEKATYTLPDGSYLQMDEHGNYVVNDCEAKVTYKANRIREFSPYINASDLLEHFIKDMGATYGVRQAELLQLPINVFIHWLVWQAAKRDGDPTDNLPSIQAALPAPPPPPQKFLPRCVCCGRFIRKQWALAKIAFCSEAHMTLQMTRLALPAPA